MDIVVRGAAADRDVQICCHHPGATVADLVDALEPGAIERGWQVLIDGAVVDNDLALEEAGLLHGSMVELSEPTGIAEGEPPRPASATFEFALVGGPAAGTSVPVGDRGLSVGRGATVDVNVADLTVSAAHLGIAVTGDRVTVDDLGSHNGARLDGEPVRGITTVAPGALLQFGAAEATVRPAVSADRPVGLDARRMASGGLLSFNRPPRAGLQPAVAEVAVPDAPAEKKRPVALSLVTLVVPILMGIIMVKVMGNIRFALFALMSPLMLIGNHTATRRRNTKESKSSARRFRHELACFESELAQTVAAERSRRESLIPDPAEIIRRAQLPSTRLWERRVGHPDYLKLRVGRAAVSWEVPVDPRRVHLSAELEAAVAESSVLPRCPVEVDLAGGGVVGLVGDRAMALSLARSLLAQACVLHGPADLGLAILADGMNAPDWDWAKWLPNSMARSGGGRLLSTDSTFSHELMAAMVARAPDGDARTSSWRTDRAGPATLVVIDDETLAIGKRSPTRAVLRGQAGPVAGIVLAATADRLPAVCNTVVHLEGDLGDAQLHRPQLAERVDGIVIAGLDDDTARGCARHLARFEDPEIEAVGAAMPAMVRLLPLLDMEGISADRVLAQWRSGGVDPAPAAPVGVGDDGILELNLVTDGPHGLVGGTTGSGKSEFLRSLVAGMATRCSPQHLVFVLIDYKGGSAFDECARLPHTVGLVTDLDEHLGERALRSLEAELHHRERTLRAHGAVDLPDYLVSGAPAGPMPRLVVVVDEFATMAAELPDFMGALVGIAQRGRSLGVHMILATQRPSGAVNANIKANTNMRIALRVQDVGDSTDVIDRPDAANIDRNTPGRAFVRLGPNEVVPVQTALSTGPTPRRGDAAVSVQPFRFGPPPPVLADASAPAAEGPTDLVRLVDACCDAFEASGLGAPRQPWLEMLAAEIPLEDVLTEAASRRGGEVPIGIADDPATQSRRVTRWEPRDGHLGLFGAAGSGTTSAAVATIVAAAWTRSPDDLHVYGIDFGGGGLGVLSGLPHVGAVIGANDRERQLRLVTYLSDEVSRRRELDTVERGREPQLVVVIDGAPAFLAEYEGLEGQDVLDASKRVLAEGAGVGVGFVITAARPAAIPMRLLATVTDRLMFSHTDPGDFATIGLRPRDLPTFVPGRAVHGGSRLVVQVGHVRDQGLIAGQVAGRWAVDVPIRRPAPIEALPKAVPTTQVIAHLSAGEPLALPIGIAESDRSVRSLQLYPGDPLFVAGQARSGVSTTLRMVARLLKRARPHAVMVAVADDRSPLRAETEVFDALGTAVQLAKVFEFARVDHDRAWVVVVDDAHTIAETHGIDDLLQAPHCHLVVGGRSEQLHGQFNHWTRGVRRDGTGLLLQPRLEADGDLLGVRLPRRTPVPLVPGRGFLVAEGVSTLVQVAGADLAA